MLFNPGFWQGTADTSQITWLQELGPRTWCSLWRIWADHDTDDLPQGYDLYVLSWHFESLDIKWIEKQTNLIDAPIILLSDRFYYNWPHAKNLFCYTYYHWHNQLDSLKQWFPNSTPKKISYKISSICNRLTQSKILIHTAIAEYIGKQHSLSILGNWLNKEKFFTGDYLLDDLINKFFKQHYSQEIRIDEWNESKNLPTYTGNPWTPIYQHCSIHATNESYHYSYKDDGQKRYIIPGPFLTEKTLKCLLGGTAFLPVGQFDTYRALETLGLEFDYGFDRSFDADPGNITRLTKLIDLIKSFANYTAMDLYEMTRNSSEYNQSMITDGVFYRNCESHNCKIIERIMVNHKP